MGTRTLDILRMKLLENGKMQSILDNDQLLITNKKPNYFQRRYTLYLRVYANGLTYFIHSNVLSMI